jgi:multidrug efflux pump subunit AcrA (membrane-fusion protein)
LIQSDQQGEYVFVVGTDGRAHRKNVTTVLLPGEDKEVTSGLASGERVVDKGSNRLTDGQPVQVVATGQPG